MNEYNLLKSINDGKHHKPKNPDLYDQDNEEVQLILKLEEQGLVKSNSCLTEIAIGVIISVLGAVLGALIAHYLGLNY